MQGLIQLSGHPLVHALGWTLLHFIWQGTAVALVLGCVLGLLGGQSSQARYGAACLALALMVVLPVATFAHVASDELKARAELQGSGVVLDEGIVVQVGINEPVPPWPARIGMALDQSLPWVLLAWFAGVILFVGRLNFGLMVARRLKTAGTEFPSPALLHLFDALRIRLGVERAVRLLHSAQVQVPTVIGWLRPVVLLPASCLTGLSPDQIEAVLCHELAHVRRHDYLVSVVQSVIETILFYHPAVWWVSKQVRRERECCCDELAVDAGGNVLAYARALSYLEENRAAFPEFVLGANGGVLKMRIKRLLRGKPDVEGSPVAALVALLMIVALAGSYFVAASRAQAQHTESNGPTLPAASVSVSQEGATAVANPASALPAVYRNWLEQDVRWIITPQEHGAFLRLTNDEERDTFINQFWARRDPPGAPEGTFRQEHYARIAYANEHFASNGQAGWSRDRGHIYIVYGKPESIDSHPTSGGTVSAYPYEVWHYKYIAGIGDNVDLVFVDTCQCGDYHYTIDPAETEARAALPGVSLAKQESAQLDAIDPQISLAKKLLAPGGAGAPQSTAPSQYQYLMPGIQDAPAVPTGISGTIVDSHGAHVPGAKVTAINTDTGAKFSLYTDSSKAYGFLALPPGPYNVEVQAKGFQNLLQENVHVAAGQMAGLNLKLSAGAGAESPSLGATQEAGAISGKIVDPTGALVPRAKVTATNTDDGVQTSRVTDNAGTYSISPLPPGPYNVEIDAKGFQRFLQENVNVKPGQTFVLNLKLTVGGAAQTLTVTGKASAAAPPPPPPPPQWAPPWNPAPPKPTGPQRVSSGVMAGLAISQPQPVYPDAAKAQHIQGVVVLRARIAKDGTVKDLQLISGPPALVVSAIDAVRQWKYKPFLLNGEPTEVDTTININYTLGDSEPPVQPGATPAPGTPQASSSEQNPPPISARLVQTITIAASDPAYPPIAKAAHVQGYVLLRVAVGKTGEAEDIKLISGLPMLVSSAMEAARKWKFSQASLLSNEGTPIDAVLIVKFTLVDTASSQAPTMGASVGFPSKDADAKAEQEDKNLMLSLRKIGGNVSQPILIYKVDPEFSAEAKKAKFNGSVLVNLIVDTNGIPQSVHVLRGVGMGLDEKAVEAIRQYRFKPAFEDGKPVPVELNCEVDFKIFDSPAPNDAPSTPTSPPASDPAVPAPNAALQYDGVPVRKVGGGVTQPEVIYKVDPEFSAEAKKAKFNGIVLVNLIVDAKGKPQNVHVLRGVGMGLDEKALAAVKKYKFKPAMEAGKPVPVDLNVEINFKIF
jgi:TonB family protein